LYSAAAALFAFFLPWDPRLVRSNLLAETAMRPSHSAQYLLLGVWQRFDSLWYLYIAQHGYSRPESIVFYPLYPALIRILSGLTGPIGTALLLSTVFAWLAFWGLQRLLSQDLSPQAVRRTLLLFAFWPGSFILFAAYAEALLLACIVWAVYLARRGQWTYAATFGVAALIAKAAGALVLVPLLVLAWRNGVRRSWPCLALVPVAFAYPLWLHFAMRSSMADAYRTYWHTQTVFPWTTLMDAAGLAMRTHDAMLIINAVALVLFIILVVGGVRRLEYLLYSLAALALFLTKHTDPVLQSTLRYLLVIFPAFIVMNRMLSGQWASRRFPMVCILFGALNLAGLWLFLKWSLVF
jgi:hypothetical protein